MQQEAKITAVFALPDATFAFVVATLRPRAEKAGQAQQDGETT